VRAPHAVAAVAAALAACGGRSAPPAPEPAAIDAAFLDAELTGYIESYGRNWGERRKLSGFVLVAQADQPVYARGFGFADRERRVAATADTSFRIGSVTKQFTAAAILVLAQDGELAVTDPIGKHLPDYPAAGAGITIHQLLTHTSGIPSYTGFPELMATRDQPRTPAELIASFADRPLEFPPGERFAYSNSGYAVLGAIIEKVSGQSYGDFVATRLFAPAGMTRTVYGDAPDLADRALGYEPSGDGLAPAPAIDLSTAFAAGGVRSTANDLVRWHRALEGDGVLDAASKARMYTPVLDDYAYGWFIEEVNGHRVIGHGGGIDGFLTDYLRIPELDLVVVTWSNNTGVDPAPIGRAAVTAALGGTLEPVDEPEVVAVDAAAAARMTGSYRLTDASRDQATQLGVAPDVIESVITLDVTFEADRLTIKPAAQPAFPVEAAGPTTFLAIEIGVTVEVDLPAEGPAAGLTLTQGGLKLSYQRQ
jgi:CubicO group peptidase (beta-lactamase class C family)